ncbi:hypothetical protein M1146_07555 [Patescibacteria group bacterium]|nr:hypothetical protein [Patescibacteria group bacterium]
MFQLSIPDPHDPASDTPHSPREPASSIVELLTPRGTKTDDSSTSEEKTERAKLKLKSGKWLYTGLVTKKWDEKPPDNKIFREENTSVTGSFIFLGKAPDIYPGSFFVLIVCIGLRRFTVPHGQGKLIKVAKDEVIYEGEWKLGIFGSRLLSIYFIRQATW